MADEGDILANYDEHVLGIREGKGLFESQHNFLCVVGVLAEILQDTYLRYKTAKEMRDTLNTAPSCTSLSSTTTIR
jgi:hypothetical protein